VLLVLGKRGSGKSYWTKRWVESRPPNEVVFIWDPTAEWAGASADHGLTGANVFRSTRDAAAVLAKQPLPRVVLQCGPEAWTDFEQLCKLVGRAGDCTFVIDEAHLWCSAGRCPDFLLTIVRLSRHWRVNLVFVAWRPYSLVPDIRDCAGRIILFQQRGKRSIDWVRDELDPELAERVGALQPREYVEWPSGATNARRSRARTSAASPRNPREMA
jgi:hypothetical protein